MPKKQVKKKQMPVEKNSTALAVVCLVINILILPGLGSLIGGKTKEGVWQLLLTVGGVVLGLLLTITIIGAVIGIPILVICPLIAWVWGIFTGAKIIKETQ